MDIITILLLLVLATLGASGIPISSNTYTTTLKMYDPLPSRRGEERFMRHLNHAFDRYGQSGTIANTTKKSLLPRDSTLAGFIEFGYYGPIQIDSQTIQAVFDSGSPFFFITTTRCTSKACKDQTKFNPDDSKHFSTDNSPFSIPHRSNDDGYTISGIVGHDNWSIGNAAATSEEIYFATSEGDKLATLPGGVVGFKPPSKTFLNLYTESGIKPQFSFRFGSTEDKTSGQLTVGGVDNTQFTGEIKFLQATTSTGAWLVDLQDVSIGSVSLGITKRTAFIDTGSALIMVPPEDAQKIHGAIEGSFELFPNIFVIPCHTSDFISLIFDGRAFKMSVENLAFEPISENPGYKPPIPKGSCISSITGLDILSRDNQWNLGYAFLRDVYIVFDYSDSNQIGFATPK